MPFDRFLAEQIAGRSDARDDPDLDERRRGRIATTFLVLGNINLEEQDKGQLDMDVVDEQLDTIGRAFLGPDDRMRPLPRPQVRPDPDRDYYALAGILRNSKTLEHANVSKWIELPLPVEPSGRQNSDGSEQAVAALKDRIKAARKARGDSRELQRLEWALKLLEADSPRERSMAVVERPSRSRSTFTFVGACTPWVIPYGEGSSRSRPSGRPQLPG